MSAFPTRLPSALDAYFGVERAAHLRARVEALLSEAWLEWQDWGCRPPVAWDHLEMCSASVMGPPVRQ